MSCQVKVIAQLADVGAIRRCLFPTDDLRGTEAWLQNTIIAVSPTGELIVFAKDKKLVVLTAKWNSTSNQSNFNISFNGSLDNADSITAVTCMPIAANSTNSEVGPDWTCIVIGFASGNVKFYTENCSLLASEQFHNERVMSIKCQSVRRAKFDRGFNNYPEEIHVIYPAHVCLVNGGNLIQTLRNYRSELAKVTAKGEHLEPLSALVNPKKWEIVDQTVVNDVAVVGLDSSQTFDHLLTASTCGGFYSKYRSMAPHNTVVVGAGAKPYVAYHYATEGGTQPVLTDVAKAVANKLKAALPNWLTGNRPQTEKPAVIMIPSEPMGCRFGLSDVRRIADKIILSPDKSLAVVSDSLGRIALIDNRRGVCIRMWKGYREAEYSFIQVQEENPLKRAKGTPRTSSKNLKIALFLVIYAPKKGTIEIWVMQQGPKIVTFSASKNSRLLHTYHGIMGIGIPSTKNKCNSPFSTILIDPNGEIKEFLIPFHFALSDKNSNRARDIHLVKRLKQFLKSDDVTDGEKLAQEVRHTCSELKTTELRFQCMEVLMNFKHVQPPVLLDAVHIFIEKVQPDENDSETMHFLALCNNTLNVTNFFMYAVGEWPDLLDLKNGNTDPHSSSSVKKQKGKTHDTVFTITDKEMNSLQRLLDFSCLKKKTVQTKVAFKNEKPTSFCDYLNAFELTKMTDTIQLRNNLTEDKMFQISEVLFQSFIVCDILDMTNFKNKIQESNIETIDLIKLILAFWIRRPLSVTIKLEVEMQSLSKLIYCICQTTKLEEICVPYNEISMFWKRIRDALAVSSNSFQALTAAVLCRSVAQKLEYDKELLSTSDCNDVINMDIWETLSQDNCQWSILIGKLEDISLLNIILASKPSISDSILPRIDYDSEEISLKYVIQKGKGCVSELVARWLIESGADPKILIPKSEDEDDVPFQLEVENAPPVEIPKPSESHLQIEESINILKKQFPYSLEPNVLLANISWEYILFWQKKIYHNEYLTAALKCIEFIPSTKMRVGVCAMIWSAHMKLLMENTTKLINKVSKLPKERFCRQDTGLSDTQLCQFINISVEFFDLFLDSLQRSYMKNETVVINYENLWENENFGMIPLAELALEHVNVNYDLIHLHSQVSLILQMITNLNVKHTKPINNLFDSTSISLLFTDISSKTNVPFYNADTKLIQSRTQFLMKVITATVESVRKHENVIYTSEHVKWMSKCVLLGNSWGLDPAILKGHQVVQLFQNGFDSVAVEVLSTISDPSMIGSALLAIAGRRLLHMIMNSTDYAEKLAALSPSFTSYLNNLNTPTDEWYAPSSVADLRNLTAHAVRCLAGKESERRLASTLLEACSTFEDS